MALSSSAPLSLLFATGLTTRSISYEIHGNSTPTKSLSGLISSAGKTGTFNNTLDFLGYSNVVAATVKWYYPTDGTLTKAEYNTGGGWVQYYFTRTQSNITGTVGCKLTYTFSSSGGGALQCGSTDGGDELGGVTGGGTGLQTWTLDNISTSASNMFFTETISGV